MLDFRLTRFSPCIDAGVPLPGAPDTDIAGNPASQGWGPDIGAYEFESMGDIQPRLARIVEVPHRNLVKQKKKKKNA